MSKILNMLNNLQTRATRLSEAGKPSNIKTGQFSKRFSITGAQSFTEFYNLTANPFADAIDLDYYFKTSSQQTACLKMHSSVRDGISLGLVTGPSGSGKTIVTQLLLESLNQDSYRTVLVLVSPRMTKTNLLKEIIRELGIESNASGSRSLLDTLHQSVVDLYQQGMRLVILIDEAHFLSSEALHMLRTVSNLEIPKKKLSTCLLFAEERFLRRLKHPSYRSLVTRMYQKAKLESMSADETAQYIDFRLMVAGGSPELIDEEFRQVIFARSGGIHREINRLCYLAMQEGQIKERQVITADLLEGV